MKPYNSIAQSKSKCKGCGKEFTKKRITHVYCSNVCNIRTLRKNYETR